MRKVRKVFAVTAGVFVLFMALIAGLLGVATAAQAAPSPVAAAPSTVTYGYTELTCQPHNGRTAVFVTVINGTDAPITVYVQPVRVYDPNLVMTHTVRTIPAGESKDIPLWEQADGMGLHPGTARADIYFDEAHSTWLWSSEQFYVDFMQGCHKEAPPPGDNPPPAPDEGGVVRPPDATGDLQILPKRPGKKGRKVLMSWDGTGIDHESKFKIMIQPPNLKTPIRVFSIAAGEVDSKLLSHRQLKPKKRMPKGTRIKYWVEHLRIDNGELIWVCVDEITVGKRKSGCRI